MSISGPSNEEAKTWYGSNQMPVVAYSSLGRGMFSGKVKSSEQENAAKILDRAALKGYGSKENFERLRRCEELATKKGCKVSQIAMAWIFSQSMNAFAVVSTSSAKRMQENIDALHISLTKEEQDYLDLRMER